MRLVYRILNGNVCKSGQMDGSLLLFHTKTTKLNIMIITVQVAGDPEQHIGYSLLQDSLGILNFAGGTSRRSWILIILIMYYDDI